MIGSHDPSHSPTALEKAAAEEEKARSKGAASKRVDGQETESNPALEERRRIRRRRKLRLTTALLGGSRSGQTSKVHLSADRKCRPPAFILTTGQAADSPQFIPVLKKVRVRGPVGRPRILPDAVAGDKAYSSRGNRAHLRERRIKAVIPETLDSYLAGLHLRASMIWIEDLTRTTR
ncbi:transposase IS4 family protein [Streptomyces venezuelae]|nr:transposase IS4 family protein [Streptomyces venezuelae]QPK43500.1 transposase [Streptomyces gardneri]CUM43781.1 Mobile element protein [Streptomyces venezuelae]